MTIERAEVEAVAALARLELRGDEATEMTRELDRILGFVATLNELDVHGVEPTSHVLELGCPERPDAERPADAVLRGDPRPASGEGGGGTLATSAPRHDHGHVVVPRVVD